MDLQGALSEGLIAQRECRYGPMQFLRTDYYMAQSLGYYGEFSEGEVELWRWLLRPGDTVVSAGANCGAHLIALARIVGPGGRVISAEPQLLLCELAQANVNANSLQATIVHAALGERSGAAWVPNTDYRWPANFGGLEMIPWPNDPAREPLPPITDAMRGAQSVPMVTVDELVDGADVRMIHLDVEGWELLALQGAQQTITRCRPLLYLEADRDERTPALAKWLAERRYQVLRHEPPLHNAANHARFQGNAFPGICSRNLLAVPV